VLVRRAGQLAVGESATAAPATPKTFIAPRWLVLHAFILAITVAMVLLGRWQLDVSNHKHFDLQNFGYALQWWAFSAFAVWLWVRIVWDRWRPPTAAGRPQSVVLPHNGDTSVHTGPADLITVPTKPGQEPVVYRGYVMPQSQTTLARSNGDSYHASYNDYLWQMKLADTARERPSVDPDAPKAIDT
jgi:hypothetical protein